MEATMEQFVGLDVSQEMTHLCVIGGDGKIVTTEIYTHVSDEALRSTLERADVLRMVVQR
jgi:hypothetical protein